MREKQRFRGRFDEDGGDPMAAMATLVDVMLVFACGLMAALALSQRHLLREQTEPPTLSEQGVAEGQQEVRRSRQLPEVPTGVGHVGGGYQAVGRVFRDAQTGKLILVESPGSTATD